jgi:hypothetical protein
VFIRSGACSPILYFNPAGVQWRTHALPSVAEFVSTETTVPGAMALSVSTSIPNLLTSSARPRKTRFPSRSHQQTQT